MNKPRRFCFGWRSKVLAATTDFFQIFATKPSSSTSKAERILLTNWGSFGDVYLTTSIVSQIKQHFPNVKIGFLLSKKYTDVLAPFAEINWMHFQDYPLTKRGVWGRVLQYFSYIRRQKNLVEEIVSKNYDVSLELYPFFPNSIPLAFKAKIPRRIGFNTSGNHRLLTDPIPWEKDQYLPNAYIPLLRALGIKPPASLKPPYLPSDTQSPIIFHMGSADARKELPVTFWKELYALFKQADLPIAFTGNGKREHAMIEAITAEKEENLCDRQSWSEFAETMQTSPLVITVDSVSSHLAAAAGRPLIIFYLFNPNIALWKPEGAIPYEKIPDPQEVFKRGMEIKYETKFMLAPRK